MATYSLPEKKRASLRGTVRSQGKASVAPVLTVGSGTSAAGSAFQGLEGDMASDTRPMAIENLGTFSVPESQPFDPEGRCGPTIELGRVRPMTRSQRDVGQALRGEKAGNEPPAQTRSRRKRKQPSQTLTTKSLGALQLPEALESPDKLQPPSSLSAQPSSSHHFECAVGNLDSPRPATLRSSTRSGAVSTPASKALSQGFLTVSGPHSSALGSSSDESGQELCQQATVQAPDDGTCYKEPDSGGSGIPGGWALRSRVVTFGHRSTALEVNPEVQPEVHTIGWNLRPRATPRVPVLHRGTLVSSPDTGSRATQRSSGSRGRSASRSSRGVSRASRGASRSSRGASRSSRSASRPGADHRRRRSGKTKMEPEPEPEPESESESDPEPVFEIESEYEAGSEPDPEPESESESESELEPELVEMERGPRSHSQARPSTSRPAFPRRASLATARSPPRRPVRMRASSPSPPGRLYPFPGQYDEGASSSSSSTSELSVSSPRSLNRSPDQGSSQGDWSSASGPSPDALWRALIPDLDNLYSSYSEESEEEVEDDPQAPGEGEV